MANREVVSLSPSPPLGPGPGPGPGHWGPLFWLSADNLARKSRPEPSATQPNIDAHGIAYCSTTWNPRTFALTRRRIPRKAPQLVVIVNN
ncbi:hypothetical protein C8035_v001994 [Colletotrichum spinosum]|uniref:Uncharacterized protein n=1 Tax=Colletotrichum spinosum TaxID=1347390 RepID=A0A4V3HRA2_9PEZI|nr:hypothetical protein C8035_v001994 [Colletotrichum spinosum]